MKKFIIFTACLLVISLLFCSCSHNAVRHYSGVYQGEFADGATILFISGAPHNEGWVNEVRIQYPDGTEQRALMGWGEGFFDIYEWREIIDYDYMEHLYSGHYRFQFPSYTTLIMELETGESFTLTKTDQDPTDYTFDAIKPDSYFYNSTAYYHRHTVSQIEDLKREVATQELSYTQFKNGFVVEDMISDATH